MQSSDYRGRGSSSLASRRPRSTASLREISSTIPTSRLILAALAITTARKWIDSSRSVDTGGGEGWCVLGYWFWRIWSDTRSRWKRKGRRKDGLSLRRSITTEALMMGMVLALQSVSFFAALGQYGPLRTVIFLSSCTLWTSSGIWSLSNIITLIPSILSTTFICYTHATFPHLTIAAILIISSCSLNNLSRRLRNGASTKDKINAPSSATVNVFAGIYALLYVGLEWYSDIIAVPVPNIAKPNAHLLFAGIIFALSRFINLPALSSGNRISPAVQTPRDYITMLLATAAIQFFALPPAPTRSDALIAVPLLLSSIFLAGSRLKTSSDNPAWSMPSTSAGYWSAISLLPPTWRPHFQTILRTPTSSKIFYFLLLNLAYMGVQMAYGVLTNSLGLISDSIHMLFDCLGLAVGLWASVAATWKPDGRYTYGYARVETLSGFANGCFLILISIFIIFEAIQRVLDPPEMETRQLLLVSSIGLAINLWGMYATGGHHHHGHGHGHDHGHGHSHAHSHHVHEKKEDHRMVNGHSHHSEHKHEHSSSTSSISHDRETHPASAHMARKRSSGTAHTLVAHQHSDVCSHDHDHDNHDYHHDHGHPSTDSHTHHDDSHANSHTHQHTHIHDHQHIHSHDHVHGGHHHSHDHAHSHNMRGVFLHVLADTLGSVGVIISTLLIRWTGWTGFDPLASLFIAGLIMASVIPLVIDSGKVLCLDVGSDSEEQIRAALSELSSVNGVANYASPRFWPRCEGELSGSIHIQLAPSPSTIDPFKQPSNSERKDHTIYANAERVVARVEKVLKDRIRGLTELVVQVEGSEDRSYCSCMTGAG